MSTVPDRLTRRPARVLPSAVLAIIAIAAGGLGTWLLGAYALDGTWPAPAADAVAAAGSVRLDSPPVLIAAGVVALLGLIFVISAIVPGDSGHRAILADDVPGQVAVSRRDIARRVQRRIEHVDGVHDARVTVEKRRVDVLVHTPVDDTETVRRRSQAVAEETLAQLRPTQPLRPRVRVTRTR